MYMCISIDMHTPLHNISLKFLHLLKCVYLCLCMYVCTHVHMYECACVHMVLVCRSEDNLNEWILSFCHAHPGV